MAGMELNILYYYDSPHNTELSGPNCLVPRLKNPVSKDPLERKRLKNKRNMITNRTK